MAHTHPVVDSDSRFVINSTTRAISTSSDKLELIQGDHQSERITFEIPKIVEGHDMSLSDRIEVHYINIDRRTKATSRDVYIADDMAVDGDKLTFSWLISGNATKYYGRLNFIILFECLDPDGNYTYKWNTEICKLLAIGEGISNTAAVAEDYSDILEKFKIEVLGEATKDTVKFTEQELSDEEKTQARDNIGAMDKYNGMTPVECTLAWGFNTRKQTIYVKNGIMKPLDYSTAEGDLKDAIFRFGFLIQGTSISPGMADMYTKAIATLIENGVFGDDFYKTATYPNNIRTLCLSQFSASLKVSLYNYAPNDESKKIFVMMVDTPNGNRITRVYNSISKTFDNVYIDYTSEPLALTATKDTDTPSLQQVEMAAAPTADMHIANKKYVDDEIKGLPQADWSQNDPSAKDYMKNRTHYVLPGSRAVVPEQEVTTAVQDNLNMAMLNDADFDVLKTLFGSKDDTAFDVVFDGVSYPCKWLEQNGNRIPVFGNLAIPIPDATDTGEPFTVSVGPAENGAMIACKVAGTHTVMVSYQQDVVHRLDPKYIGEISGETLSVTGTVEFASDSWASDYSYFTDSWLTMNADHAKISIEINGKLVEDLPYSSGSYGAFTFGNVDTLGVAITNSGRGNTTQHVTVSTMVFPNGIKVARVFRKIAYRIPVDSLPEVISWIAKRTEDEFVLTGHRKFVTDNEVTQVTDTIPSYDVFDVYVHNLMLLKCHAGESFFDMSNTNRISIRNGTGNIKTVDVLMPDGTPVTANNWPKGATLLGLDRLDNVYLLNPRSNELILPSSTTGSTKKFRITVDDAGTISATEVVQ